MDKFLSAHDEAIRRLKYRLYSSKEIESYLLRKKYNENEILLAIKKLKEQNYLNDYEFIKNFVSGRAKRKMLSKKRIISEVKGLVEEGIDIESSVEKNFAMYNEDEDVLLTNLIEKKLKGRSPDNLNEKELNALYSYAIRKGYSYNDIKRKLNFKKTL